MIIKKICSGTGGGQVKLKYTNLSEGKGKNSSKKVSHDEL
jgi:hypothetical protein